jgi:hypothetical protein
VNLSASAGLLLSLAMLGVFALMFGSAFAWRKGTNRKQAALMAVAALVLLANVLILVWPMA